MRSLIEASRLSPGEEWNFRNMCDVFVSKSGSINSIDDRTSIRAV
jgi:hypothetical protein